MLYNSSKYLDISYRLIFDVETMNNILIYWVSNIIQTLKGQIISECPYEIIACPKIATKKFPKFLPWPLGEVKSKTLLNQLC